MYSTLFFGFVFKNWLKLKLMYIHVGFKDLISKLHFSPYQYMTEKGEISSIQIQVRYKFRPIQKYKNLETSKFYEYKGQNRCFFMLESKF